jgi:hypothetical protein
MISRIGPVPNIADSSGHDAHASRKPAILANADQITRAPFVAFQRAAATESNRYHVIAAYENPARVLLKLKGGVSGAPSGVWW